MVNTAIQNLKIKDKNNTDLCSLFCSLFTDYLAKAVDDDECGSQEVTVGGVFSHDVLIPQLDGHQGAKQLAQLLNQQVELTLDKHTKLETTSVEEASLDASIKLFVRMQVTMRVIFC